MKINESTRRNVTRINDLKPGTVFKYKIDRCNKGTVYYMLVKSQGKMWMKYSVSLSTGEMYPISPHNKSEVIVYPNAEAVLGDEQE